MSERVAAVSSPATGMAVTEQQIAQALDSLLRGTNTFTSLNGIVQQLESKMGVELGHKIDFIRAQIHHFLLLQSQPQSFMPYHYQLQNGNFPAFHQTPNFYPAVSQFPHLPLNFTGRPPIENLSFRSPPQPQPRPPMMIKNPSAAAVKESAPSVKKRRGGPGGLNKLCGVSPELQTIVGQPTLARTEIVKQLWAYIRKNNLQDPSNKRKIICNDELRLVFETDCTDMFKMNKLLAKHILPLETTKQVTHNAKKPKVDVESGSKSGGPVPFVKSGDPVPFVTISEGLASLFGSVERKMSQVEVLRQMWEYIRVNQLEDLLNPTAIVCDAKLQELLGCESISALGIPEILAQRHLFKKS